MLFSLSLPRPVGTGGYPGAAPTRELPPRTCSLELLGVGSSSLCFHGLILGALQHKDPSHGDPLCSAGAVNARRVAQERSAAAAGRQQVAIFTARPPGGKIVPSAPCARRARRTRSSRRAGPCLRSLRTAARAATQRAPRATKNTPIVDSSVGGLFDMKRAANLAPDARAAAQHVLLAPRGPRVARAPRAGRAQHGACRPPRPL